MYSLSVRWIYSSNSDAEPDEMVSSIKSRMPHAGYSTSHISVNSVLRYNVYKKIDMYQTIATGVDWWKGHYRLRVAGCNEPGWGHPRMLLEFSLELSILPASQAFQVRVNFVHPLILWNAVTNVEDPWRRWTFTLELCGFCVPTSPWSWPSNICRGLDNHSENRGVFNTLLGRMGHIQNPVSQNIWRL